MATMSDPRTWLITGCSSGFGRALSEAVLADGDIAVLTARNPGSLAELVERYPRQARTMTLDVTRPEQIARVVAETEAQYGGIDVLVNNAGYGVIGAIEETPPEDYRPMFEVNFFGAMEVIRAALPGMRRRRRGHIVNMSSVAGYACRPGYGFYAASKFALEGASEGLAKEVEPLGIAVTLIEPGPFRTDFAGRSLRKTDIELDDYAPTSGASRAAITERDGQQPGDPRRAAALIIEATRAEEPPLRLPLGRHAYARARDKVAAWNGIIETWEERAGAAVEYE
jgi:NAD(P)-dependent dehydrogenase (short-subunit alcohol dehydrogenase family)